MSLRSALARLCILASFCATPAFAQAGPPNLFNIHAEPAVAIPLHGFEGISIGRSLTLKLDVPLAHGFAVQGLGQIHAFRPTSALGDQTLVGAGLGVRYYLPVKANVWVDANAVLLRGGDRERPGVDVGAGFGVKLLPGLHAGPFARASYIGNRSLALLGLSISVGAPRAKDDPAPPPIDATTEAAAEKKVEPPKPVEPVVVPPVTPPAPPRVALEPGRVVISEAIFFALDEAQVLPQSFPVLDEVAAVLQKNPQIQKVRVDGHTDDTGDDAYNQTLSEARARAVRDYLVGKGVAPERLDHRGFGKTQPVAQGTDEQTRARNRRVEFTIIETAKTPAQTPAE